jgi:hypothetical protein
METSVSMSARELMQSADRLTGVSPRMNHEQIRAALNASPPEKQKARYLIDIAKGNRDPSKRAEARMAITALAAEFPHLGTLVHQALAGIVSITAAPRSGRPRKHVDERARRRAASRAYRERVKNSRSLASKPSPRSAHDDRR